jgi:hypothetical protein
VPNHLAGETSPYLLQHAANPVEWYPWGDEALARARAEDRPILLSVGYSSCHWCHVMAHESFADQATADVMNACFVNVKVDREERPDLDRVYQVAHQLLTRQAGGWPLTAFLDPHTCIPFFSGTYFPRRARYQLPGFVDLLLRISQAWKEKRTDIEQQGEKMRQAFTQVAAVRPPPDALPEARLADEARGALEAAYDARHGGFGGAPKFPMPAVVEFLLRHFACRQRDGHRERATLDMVMSTLTQMARGGIHDHVGGGFFRYSTDAQWLIPHFEKMLYDNAPLLALYASALRIGPDELFEGVVRDAAGWVLREMQHADGGYFCSLDADADGEEGRFYVWRRAEVKQLLDADEYLVVETLYGLDRPANFEGRWNLHRTDAWRAVCERLSLERPRADATLASARRKLFEARARRIRPALDDKVLPAWNGLMIHGMATAAMVLGEPAWLASAQRAADFVRTRLFAGGRLYATWRNGVARHPGYLDDYANMLLGLTTLLQAGWRDEDARLAVALANGVLSRFEDRDGGGFFFTADDHEALLQRLKPAQDESLPPANGTLAHVLAVLGHLFGDSRYLEAAARTLRWARDAMSRQPAAHCTLLAALDGQFSPPELVLVHGPGAAIGAWLDVARAGYRPWRFVFGIANDVPLARPPLLPPYLPRMVPAEQRAAPVAWVCKGSSCSLPIRDLGAFAQAVK